MQKKISTFIFSIAFCFALLLHADCRQAYAQPHDIDTDQLQARMQSGQEFVLVNVLPKIIYDSKHLPGSINCPIGKLEKMAELPFPKNKPLVFYCMGHL